MMNIYYEPCLYHHGVKGQQWGVENGPPYPLSRLPLGEQMRIKKKRKLQKQNEAIRKKNSALRKKNKEKEENQHLKERQKQLKEEQKALKKGKTTSSAKKDITPNTDSNIVKEPAVSKKAKDTRKPLTKRDIHNMSDEEIRTAIERRKIEKELWDRDNQMITSGRREVKAILSDVGKKTVTNIATTAATNAGKIMVRKIIASTTGNEELANEIMPKGGGEKKKKEENKN